MKERDEEFFEYRDRQIPDKKEYEATRKADLADLKKRAHGYLDKLDNSFVVFSPKSIEIRDDGVALQTSVMTALCGNMADAIALVLSAREVENRVLQSFAKRFSEEDMEQLLSILGNVADA